MLAAKLIAGLSLSIGPEAAKKHVLSPVAYWLQAVAPAYSRGFTPGSNPLGLGGGADAPVDRQAPALPPHYRTRMQRVYPPEAIHIVYATIWALVPTSESAVRVGEWRSNVRQAVKQYAVYETLLAQQFGWGPNSPPPLPLGFTSAAATISSFSTAPNPSPTVDRWAAPLPPPSTALDAAAAGGVERGDREREVASMVLRDGGIVWPFVGECSGSWKAHQVGCVVIKYIVDCVPEALLMLTIRTRDQAGGVRLIVAHPLERVLLSAGKVSKFSSPLYSVFA